MDNRLGNLGAGRSFELGLAAVAILPLVGPVDRGVAQVLELFDLVIVLAREFFYLGLVHLRVLLKLLHLSDIKARI